MTEPTVNTMMPMLEGVWTCDSTTSVTFTPVSPGPNKPKAHEEMETNLGPQLRSQWPHGRRSKDTGTAADVKHRFNNKKTHRHVARGPLKHAELCLDCKHHVQADSQAKHALCRSTNALPAQ